MKICIHKSVIGTDRHLVHDSEDESYVWSPSVPEGTWVLGDLTQEKSIDDLALGIGKTIDLHPRGKWVRQFQEIFGDDISKWSVQVPWPQVLPRKVFQRFVKDLIQKSLDVFESSRAISYGKTLQNSRSALLQLSRAKVNPTLWGISRRSTANGQVEAVESFKPDSNGFAPPISYGRSETTGRVRVLSGPKILHLKKDYRRMLTSRWSGGSVYQMDYVSMEPRILMAIVGREPGEDVYEYTAREVLDGKLSRKDTKAVVMGVLYGVGTAKLQSMIGNKVNAAAVMAEVKSHFGVRILEDRLKKEMQRTGAITSHYGRVLKPTRTDGPGLVSYHVQSTGVDLALQGFNVGLQHIRDRNLKIKPIYVIHDAILLDVHPDVTDYDLKNVAEAASHPPGFETIFPLDVTKC